MFKERLSGNKIKPNLINLEKDTNKLSETRLKLNKSKPCEMEDLKEVLNKLGQEKSKDADGLANELFTVTVAGQDLLEAVL